MPFFTGMLCISINDGSVLQTGDATDAGVLITAMKQYKAWNFLFMAI
jgi:hypothetical protein